MKNTMFVLYEQIKPDDAFGKMMIRNLKSRNIELKGIQAYPDLEHQEKRFIDLGWQAAKAVDINAIHDKYTSQEELSRY
jgi:tRNA wybutosine-synthesizing protein 4